MPRQTGKSHGHGAQCADCRQPGQTGNRTNWRPPMPCERDTLIQGENEHMVEVMPEDRIARLMTIRDLVSAGQQAPAGPALPDNTLRNNDTGATYSFQSQAPGASYQADYANPIEIAGLAAGIASKAILWQRSSTVSAWILASMVQQSQKRQAENLKLMAAQQGIQSGALDIQEKQRAAQMGKRPSLPPGYAWSEDGTRAVQIPGLEDVAKPADGRSRQGGGVRFAVRRGRQDHQQHWQRWRRAAGNDQAYGRGGAILAARLGRR